MESLVLPPVPSRSRNCLKLAGTDSAPVFRIQEDWRQLGLLEVLAAWYALVSFKSKAYILYMFFQSVCDGSDVLGGNS